MKRGIFAVIVLIGLIGLQGCYTQLVVRESRPYRSDTPDYSETYTDSSGTVINDNYYYDDNPRSSAYFSYYYPIRSSYMWPTYYDPFWDWNYSPWIMYPTYYSPWYSNPFYWGGSAYIHYPYYRHHWYWDRYPVYSYQSSSNRPRTFGTSRTADSRVRDYGVTRGGFTGSGTTTGPSSIRTRSADTRSSDAVDRISTRSRDRATVPQGNYSPPAGTRSRSEGSSTPGYDGRSRSRESSGSSEKAVPQSDTRSRERSGSSYSPPERSSSPPPSSSGGSSSGGGSRSRGSDGGSSSGGGRSRGR